VLVARDTDRLRQVQFTLTYSRRVAALGRLSAGLAHEIKNPLNATMIRLELLRQQLSAESVEVMARRREGGLNIGPEETSDAAELREHVEVISAQIRRLDEVVQGFLKFHSPRRTFGCSRWRSATFWRASMPIVEAEAHSHDVDVRTELPVDLPDLAADQAMLEQAFLNLAINACQAIAARWQAPRIGGPDLGPLRRGAVRGHRRRDPARRSRQDLRPVFHYQGGGAVALACPWSFAPSTCTGRNYGRVNARPRHDLSASSSPGMKLKTSGS